MKDRAYYMGLPYTRRVRIEEGKRKSSKPYFVAYIQELDGVEAEGVSPEDARFNLQHAFEDYLDAMLKWGDLIPEPELWPRTVTTPSDSRASETSAVTVEHVLREGDEFPWRDARPRWALRDTKVISG